MATTYTWHINALDCATDNDIDCDTVDAAIWTLDGTDGTNTGTYSGKTPIHISMAATEGQVAGERFSALTESEVITTVQAALGSINIAAIEADISRQIQEKVGPTLISPTLPWV